MGELVAINDAGKQWLEDMAADAESRLVVATPAGPSAPMQRLLDRQAADGQLPNAVVAAVAAEVGLSARQLRRRIKAFRDAGELPNRRAYELTDDHMQVIFAHCGNVAAAHRDLAKAGKPVPALTTFRDRWNEQPAHIRAMATQGASGARAMWLHVRYQAPSRNAIWYADHFELPVDVIADGHRTTTMKPWLTIFEDDRTRRIMSWAISANVGRRVGADVVIACIAEAIRTRTILGNTVGGVPDKILWDNALEFLSGEVTQFATLLGFEATAVRPYSGHLKGKVERLGQTVQDDFCVMLDGYTHGPDTYTGHRPFRSTATPMTADLLRARFADWVEDYNEQRPHSSLGGTTPHETWVRDATPLRLVGDDRLRSGLLVAPKTQKVHNTGVHFRKQWWLGPGLVDHVNRNVEIRYPTDREAGFIELYYQGTWLCTAYPAAELTEDDKRRILGSRHDQYEKARSLQEAAKRRRAAANATADEGLTATGNVGKTRAKDPYTGDVGLILEMTGTDASEPFAAAGEHDAAGEPAAPKTRKGSKR